MIDAPSAAGIAQSLGTLALDSTISKGKLTLPSATPGLPVSILTQSVQHDGAASAQTTASYSQLLAAARISVIPRQSLSQSASPPSCAGPVDSASSSSRLDSCQHPAHPGLPAGGRHHLLSHTQAASSPGQSDTAASRSKVTQNTAALCDSASSYDASSGRVQAGEDRMHSVLLTEQTVEHRWSQSPSSSNLHPFTTLQQVLQLHEPSPAIPSDIADGNVFSLVQTSSRQKTQASQQQQAPQKTQASRAASPDVDSIRSLGRCTDGGLTSTLSPCRRPDRAVHYGAIFLTDEAKLQLLAAVPPQHCTRSGDHVTLVFQPTLDKVGTRATLHAVCVLPLSIRYCCMYQIW